MKARLSIAGGLTVAAASAILAMGAEAPFPHARHEGLFPVCTGCHAGIPEGDSSRFYPPSEACVNCHDGGRLETVEPPAPGQRVSNLRFSHVEHDREVAARGERPACETCHAVPDSASRMAVTLPGPDACVACHAHEAPSHLAEGRDCAACHRPLSEVPDLPAARIAGFPVPGTHEEPDFLLDHDPGPATDRCATCHARESCARCHLESEAPSPVVALAPDSRVAGLVEGRPPRYPKPPGHEESTWSLAHGAAALEDPGTCATCHVRSSCTGCHQDAAPAPVARLPVVPEGDPRGVQSVRTRPVHAPGYATDHGPAAAADGACSSCHRTSTCESCHAGTESPPFHLPNFLERHGPEAYSAATDCSSCHSTEVFCRACHTGLGLGDQRTAGVTFHTSRPFWLMGHGTAARQGLEGCTSCHDQGDCATCHSASFGWRVNPHGPSFDAERSREASPFSCARCHRGGGSP